MLESNLSSRLGVKLYFVYFLNVVDWICTVSLLSTGLFYEANPLSRTFISNNALGFALKCVLPFLLIFLSARFLHILEFSQLKVADMLISFALTVYLFITLDHFINFILLLFFWR